MDDLFNSVFGTQGGVQTRQSSADDSEFSSDQIKIVTAGFGGGGNNTINRLLKTGVKGTDLVAVNTDAQHFKILDERIKKVLIGRSITRGLGAGGNPEVGKKAAEVELGAWGKPKVGEPQMCSRTSSRRSTFEATSYSSPPPALKPGLAWAANLALVAKANPCDSAKV